jgi:hypothetical protein
MTTFAPSAVNLKMYFVTLIAYNAAGPDNSAYSGGVPIEWIAPEAGSIEIGEPQNLQLKQSHVHFLHSNRAFTGAPCLQLYRCTVYIRISTLAVWATVGSPFGGLAAEVGALKIRNILVSNPY